MAAYIHFIVAEQLNEKRFGRSTGQKNIQGMYDFRRGENHSLQNGISQVFETLGSLWGIKFFPFLCKGPLGLNLINPCHQGELRKCR